MAGNFTFNTVSSPYQSQIPSTIPPVNSPKHLWMKAFAEAMETCKFSKIKSHFDQSSLSKTLLQQFRNLLDAEKLFLQMRFHAPQSRLLFFSSSKEPSTAALFQSLADANVDFSFEDNEIMADISKVASCRLVFIDFLTILATDQTDVLLNGALKKLGTVASWLSPTVPSMTPFFERLRNEFKALYHAFETLQLINKLNYIDSLIAMQQSFAQIEQLEVRVGLATNSSGTYVATSSGSSTTEPWQKFYAWLRNVMSHVVGKFCTFFYTAVNPYLVPDNRSIATSHLPGLLARSSYPDFIGKFFTLAKKFSVEILLLICDPVGGETKIEPFYRLEIGGEGQNSGSQLHVLMSYWPGDPTHDPTSVAFLETFNRFENFILKLITQHRIREEPYTTAEMQNTKTILAPVDTNTFLLCAFSFNKGFRESHIISAVTELASVLRCKAIFTPLKDACLQ